MRRVGKSTLVVVETMVKAFQGVFIPQDSLFKTLAHLPGTLVIKDIRVPERGDFDGAKNIDGLKIQLKMENLFLQRFWQSGWQGSLRLKLRNYLKER